ncbi:NERD domain-containing protein [Candidatus Saccharibacteria bacterium]|nr:NERD domain-containing protein [Candidatus Saccharibacteria bacterium]
MDLWILPLLTFIILTVIIAVIWLFYDHGANRLKHPEEWQNTGSSGEQIIFLTLNKKLHIPENQILRNVYIPTENGKTSEIDLLVVSKKGLFVFEIKNYAGNIYGDTKRKKWIQYLGKKKSFFYNPLLQNRTHCENLHKYLKKYGDIPIVPLLTTISRGKWKIKNLSADDYFLGYNCHLIDIYNSMPICETMSSAFKPILSALTPLSRPSKEIVEKHIQEIKKC